MSPVVERRRVLVTGCGRSGSKYIAFVLRRLGLDVPHERLGRDGISSWTMAVPAEERPYGPPSSLCAFDHVLHQVREPLAAIGSATTFGPESWDFICAHTDCAPDEPVVVRAARYWLAWNEHAERVAEWRYRVEDLDTELPELCRRLGVPCDMRVLERVPRDVNTRRSTRRLHLAEELLERLRLDMPPGLRAALGGADPPEGRAPLRYDDIDELEPGLGARIRQKALEYGYTGGAIAS